MRKYLLLCAFSCFLISAHSQDVDSSQLKNDTIRHHSLTGIPALFYLPETSWGVGAAMVYTHRYKGQAETVRPSQFTLGGAYTFFHQIMSWLTYRAYSKDQNYIVYGEFGYYKFVYDFFGIGPNIPRDYVEKYFLTYPEIRINGLRQIDENWSGGIGFNFKNYKDFKVEEGGLLDLDQVIGSRGGITSGIGATVNYDTRNHLYWPSKGAFVELRFVNYNQLFGSDFSFNKFEVKASKYMTINKDHLLAVNGIVQLNSPGAPFFDNALLGGSRNMRGYYEGRYRDNHLAVFNAEYRSPYIWRLAYTLFGSMGAVAPEVSKFSTANLHFNGGLGLRFALDQAEKVNIRIDLAFSEFGFAPYFTLAESF